MASEAFNTIADDLEQVAIKLEALEFTASRAPHEVVLMRGRVMQLAAEARGRAETN